MYILPENSSTHDMYDVNIFQLLESDINFFNSKGKVSSLETQMLEPVIKLILLTTTEA